MNEETVGISELLDQMRKNQEAKDAQKRAKKLTYGKKRLPKGVQTVSKVHSEADNEGFTK